MPDIQKGAGISDKIF